MVSRKVGSDSRDLEAPQQNTLNTCCYTVWICTNTVSCERPYTLRLGCVLHDTCYVKYKP